MAVDPNLITALQGPQLPSSPGLFGVQPQHLQQMAGELVPFPGVVPLLRSSNPAGLDMPGRYVGQGPRGYQYFGADPKATEMFQKTGDKAFADEYWARRASGGPGGGGKNWATMHPNPGTLMRIMREEGLLPD